MSFEALTVFALFWVVFVTTPGPNAVNCITNGMHLPFARALVGVLAILTQATVFLVISALGVTALVLASPDVFLAAKIAGAAFLIYLGVSGWLRARTPLDPNARPARQVYLRALAIATINPKSLAGYLAAFSTFVQPDVPIWPQMAYIVPTALTITAISYTLYTALGAGLGRAAFGVLMNTWIRRGMSLCFVVYGVALGSTALPARGTP
jgi:homoserine/homoserine lactone efflux protein